MTDLELDARVVAWLRQDPPVAPAWALEAVIHHARRHPRPSPGPFGWRSWSSRIGLDRARPLAIRPGLAIGGVTIAIAVSTALLVGWRPAVTPGATPTSTIAPSPSATPGGPAVPLSQLEGAWFSSGGVFVTLRDCTIDRACGTIEVINPELEHCVYGLEYASPARDAYAFTTGVGSTMSCAWSGWSDADIELTPKQDSLVALSGGPTLAAVPLWRVVDAPAAPGASGQPWVTGAPIEAPRLPPALRGTWFSAEGTVVTLGPCAVGETCGTLDRIDNDYAALCLYPLQYTAVAAGAHDFSPGMGNSFACGWSPWSHSSIRLIPPEAGLEDTVELRLAPSFGTKPITLYRAAS